MRVYSANTRRKAPTVYRVNPLITVNADLTGSLLSIDEPLGSKFDANTKSNPYTVVVMPTTASITVIEDVELESITTEDEYYLTTEDGYDISIPDVRYTLSGVDVLQGDVFNTNIKKNPYTVVTMPTTASITIVESTEIQSITTENGYRIITEDGYLLVVSRDAKFEVGGIDDTEPTTFNTNTKDSPYAPEVVVTHITASADDITIPDDTVFDSKTRTGINIPIIHNTTVITHNYRNELLKFSGRYVKVRVDSYDNVSNTLTIHNTMLDYGVETPSSDNFSIFVNGMRVTNNFTVKQIGNDVVITLAERYVSFASTDTIYIYGKFIVVLEPETLVYRDRVESDGGIVLNLQLVNDEYKRLKTNNEYETLELFWHYQMGIRLSDESGTLYVEKLYDLSPHSRDVIAQTTEKRPIYNDAVEFGGTSKPAVMRCTNLSWPTPGLPIVFRGLFIPYSLYSAAHCLFDMGGWGSSHRGISLMLNTSGRIRYFQNPPTGAPTSLTQFGFIGVESKIGMSWNGNIGQSANLYLNDSFIESVLPTGTTTNPSITHHYWVGSYNYGNSGFYHGKIKYQQFNSIYP
jgi:hypothetical protein